jgi:hypothetical protein
MHRPATPRDWLWPAAIAALFLLLFAGASWLAVVAVDVGEVPLDNETHPAVVGGNRP